MTVGGSVPQEALLAIEQAFNEAVACQRSGDLHQAEKLYQAILQIDPAHPKANHNQGTVAVQLGRPAAGLPYFIAALDADPAQAQYWLSYIDALALDNQMDSARQTLALAREHGLAGDEVDALAVRLHAGVSSPESKNSRKKRFGTRPNNEPNAKEINSLITLLNQGLLSEAAAKAQGMTERFPEHWAGWKMLGVVYNRVGQNGDAIGPMQKATALQPNDAEAHNNLAIALDAVGRLDEAAASYQRVIRINPDHAKANGNLGLALYRLGRLGEAEVAYRRTLEIDPEAAMVHWALGVILHKEGRLDEAVTSYRRAIQAKPDMVEAHNNLGAALRDIGLLVEAEASSRRALRLRPGYADAHNNLGIVLYDGGHLDEAAECYRRALQIDPDAAETHSNLLFCLSNDTHVDAQTLYSEHLGFGDHFEAPFRGRPPQHANPRDAERGLRIGFVSGDLRNHAVASFVEPMLVYLSGFPQLSLYAYSNLTAEDEVSGRLRKYFAHWIPVAALSDQALDQRIREDGIDILFDLSGHSAKSRLAVFARKPAPIQVSWIGYPGTTGLRAMDYYLADKFFLPEERFAWQFTEKLVYLPTTVPFVPAEVSPDVNPLPALSRGFVTFGSFNRPSKIGRDQVALWSRLLGALPDSRMLICAMPLDDNHETMVQWFTDEGIERGRLDFHKRCNLEPYLALHQQVDICLDTFPYTGGTTINHALWMGVPTLTMVGDTPASWSGARLMSFACLEEFIAENADDFVAKGLDQARHIARLAEIRAGLRDRFNNSPLGQPALVADAFQRAMRIMWQRWCADLAPESFEVTANKADPTSEKSE